jgi:hypothetical protein
MVLQAQLLGSSELHHNWIFWHMRHFIPFSGKVSRENLTEKDTGNDFHIISNIL